MTGVILLPSLERAKDVAKFFESYLKTKTMAPVWVIVDDLDPQLEEYKALFYPSGCEIKVTTARSMGEKCNELWEAYRGFDYVIICNDDHVLMTEGWDQTCIGQLSGVNVVFTNDGMTPETPWNFPKRLCGAICFSGKLLRTLGWLFPPGIKHLYSDEIWGQLFARGQCTRGLGDVCVYHEHGYLKPEKQDKTFKLINGEKGLVNGEGTSDLWLEDKKAFEKYMSTSFETDVQKIMDLQPKQGVMIATPSHDGNVAMAYALGLADASINLAQHGVYFEMARVVGSSLIPHARNSLVDMFLRSKCQRLLFIDSDQGFDKNAVFSLLQSPRLIIAGITPHKRFPINLNFEPLPDDHKYFKSLTNKGMEEFKVFAKDKADPLGNIEVNRVGTGIVMIDRKVFDLMKEHVEHYEPFDDRTDVVHGEYFKFGIGPNKRYLGEDWHFTSLAKKLKIPIYINANVIVSHTGTYTFTA